MEFVTSQKNKNQNLVHEGYIYNHHKDNKDGSKKTYRCQKRYSKRCPGTATVEGDIVTAKGAHNHLPNIEEIEKRKTLKQIYDHLNVVRNFNIENVLDILKNVNIAASVE